MASFPMSNASVQRQAILILPIVVGAVIGKLNDSHIVSAIILFLEPLLWLVSIHLMMALCVARRKAWAAALLLSTVTGIFLIHHPLNPMERDTLRLDSTNTDRPKAERCAKPTRDSAVPIRILQWTTDTPLSDPTNMDTLARLQHDLLVLRSTGDVQWIDRLAEDIRAEVLHLEPTSDGTRTSLMVRGAFMNCGVERYARLSPDNSDGTELALVWIDFSEAGPTPVVVAMSGGPTGFSDLGDWFERIGSTQAAISATHGRFRNTKLILLGDLSIPRSFRSLGNLLTDMGLSEATVPASWPSSLGGVPLPGLHPMDRLWTGRSWMPEEGRRIRLPGHSRAMILTDLRSRRPKADEYGS